MTDTVTTELQQYTTASMMISFSELENGVLTRLFNILGPVSILIEDDRAGSGMMKLTVTRYKQPLKEQQ